MDTFLRSDACTSSRHISNVCSVFPREVVTALYKVGDILLLFSQLIGGFTHIYGQLLEITEKVR